jgi:UDP-N-acetylmuramate dehydrogenase
VIPPQALAALRDLLGDRVELEVPMARFTSLRIGGPADALATPANRDELAELLRICARHRVARTIIGAGFNTLVLDGGLDGVAIQLKKLRLVEERPGGLIRAEAGASHSQVTRFCAQRCLTGLEFGVGIPGTVGGWLAMNAGIGEREMKDVVSEVEVMSPCGRKRTHLARADLCYRYRALRGLAPGSVIVSALLRVHGGEPETIRSEMRRLLDHRLETQPVDVPSCGSVFKNPPGDFAGRLVEAAGLKGEREGGAQISPVHANFITNLGNARASDVLVLLERARAQVLARFGVRLEAEVKMLGREAP